MIDDDILPLTVPAARLLSSRPMDGHFLACQVLGGPLGTPLLVIGSPGLIMPSIFSKFCTAKFNIRAKTEARAYPSFLGIKQLEVFLLPSGWDASLSQGYPHTRIKFASTHSEIRVERDPAPWPGAEPTLLDLESSTLYHITIRSQYIS